ncbi:TonB-dependent receptor [Novosphingobium sp. G106]|uniref:TonB-dependent receptor domain-containing protein n=1 Tax=Novosphingobium sp. G106 TaxID=2849500 RepID=UPI001C2D2FB3|nr:TonB-dependent receptor [Novosphingobium sp. G106]MBV1691832.1 TonB-dependent receptor [Novosphingobium sp. G106]
MPQKPTDRLEGWVEGSAGGYNLMRGQMVLNVPLADTFKVRVTVDRNKRDGYVKNHSGTGADDFANVNYFAARLSIVADLTPDLENYTVATYSHSFGRGYGSRLIACDQRQTTGILGINAQAACAQIARQNARGDGPLDSDISNPNPFVNQRTWQVINTTTWQASDDLTVKNIASYSEFRERLSNNLNGDNFFLGTTPFQVTFQDVFDTTSNQAAESGFTEELQLHGKTGDGRFDWQLGAYVELSRPLGWNQGRTGAYVNCTSICDIACTNPLGFGSITQASQKASFDSKGLYAQGTYKLTDQLSMTAGLRYTWDTTKVSARSSRLNLAVPAAGVPQILRCSDPLNNPGATPGTGKVVTDINQCLYTYPLNKSHAPTWMVDLEYKPASDLLFYAKYARGYRTGGINPNNFGFEAWDPEKVDTYELGAKASFHGAVSGYFNITGFYNDFSNQQLSVGVSPVLGSGFAGSTAVVNAGKSRLSGIEVDLSATFFDSLRFDLGYAYLDTELKSFVPPTIPPALSSVFAGFTQNQIVGGPLSLSPKHRVTLTGTYTLPVSEHLGRISLSATYVYTSAQYFSRADDAFVPFLDGTNSVQLRTANIPLWDANLGRLPATNLVNLNLNWNEFLGQPIDLSAFVTNVTNQIYPVATGSTLSQGYETAIFGAPRMWGIRIKYRFGS